VTETEAAAVLDQADEDPAAVRARLLAMTGGDPAAHAQRCRDSMSAAYAREDTRNGIGPEPRRGSRPATLGKSGEEQAVSGGKAGTLTVKVTPDTSGVVAAARIVAKHLTAMADELEALNGEVMPSEPVPADL
jgi:hypothetical protein